MPAFSGLQQLLTGLVYAYSGYHLINDPSGFLRRLEPLTGWVEETVGVGAYKGGEEGLVFVGVLAAVLGYYFIMSVYTLDERFKRNSVSGRILTALLSLYVHLSTPHSSSLIVLFGLFNALTGAAMGMSVGWGDGNAVDLELKARALARQKAAEKGGKKGK